MSVDILIELLTRNRRHSDRLPAGYFSSVREGQQPVAVSVCCSDSRVPQTGMWDVDEPGWLFTPSTIGNQVWDTVDGDLVVDGSVLYPIQYTETKVTIVTGHTDCGAIKSAYSAVVNGNEPIQPGIKKRVALLKPVIEAGLADERVTTCSDGEIIDRLVEYNVDQQIHFLRGNSEIPDDELLYGFVYDFHSRYGSNPGRAYLVNLNGQTDVEIIREELPAEYHGHVRRLIS